MFEILLRDPFTSPIGRRATSAQALVAAMCRFEIALARVNEAAGQLPSGAATAIAADLCPDKLDVEQIAAEAADGGNAAIAFVKHARALLPATWAAAFHRGATSQDVIDTALMLVIKPRLSACLAHLDAAVTGGSILMQRYAATPMSGRTLTQQALPITVGVKFAQWLTGLMDASDRLADVHEYGLFVQFGGPVGVHHSLDDGLDLMAALASELGLACPNLPWHTNRQPILALIDAIGAVAVAAEKIATDMALMAQTEIGEAHEPAATGAGGSSSMPHKTNPVGCTRIRAAARQIHAAVGLMHSAAAHAQERAFGEWHAEWAPLMDSVLLLEGMLETLVPLLSDLQIDTQAMRRNLAIPGGANLSAPTIDFLVEAVSRESAQAIARHSVQSAWQTGRDYADVLIETIFADQAIAGRWSSDEIRAAVDPAAFVGSSQTQIERVNTRIRSRTGSARSG